jgi:uncharacterized repeat protein (TIGR04061 family)
MTLSPRHRDDCELFDDLASPARLMDYPRDSRAFVRIDTSLRAYWHALFDICPELLELSGPDGMAIFRPFMDWAGEQNHTFNWTYYLLVYEWLRQSEFAGRLDDDLRLSLMGAAAARWAIRERGRDCGIALGSADMAGLVIGWKCCTVHTGRQIELVEPQEALPAPEGAFGYFLLPDFEFSSFPGWRRVPF